MGSAIFLVLIFISMMTNENEHLPLFIGYLDILVYRSWIYSIFLLDGLFLIAL